ncbi:hypothetical protein NDU88_006597 [Pleurodeles waltl]|uniref:Uncharacterized protein n=1 Tax=Pleurodeles waltl TaxID=8319 RepID=A0AAV7PR55_PLEWA|nr:hypothetical protein NDU88_006597 [Pleurodeles waltl]
MWGEGRERQATQPPPINKNTADWLRRDPQPWKHCLAAPEALFVAFCRIERKKRMTRVAQQASRGPYGFELSSLDPSYSRWRLLWCSWAARIVEAHDEYGGTAWKEYDKEFRRIKTYKSSLAWDHIHKITWLRYTNRTQGPGQQPFHGPAGTGSGASGGTGAKMGACWDFNQRT